jgi:MFS family permease
MTLALLLSAAFFNGYDNQAISLILPDIQHTFRLSTAALGALHGPIVAGQLLALPVMRIADRYGRRPVLLGTIVAYTAFTGLTATSWDVWSFIAFQFFAQASLGAEFAAATTIVVEDYPTDRRGRALGTLLMFGPLGTIGAAALLAAGLEHGPLGWRSFYLVGLAPLVLVAVARRAIKETDRFVAEHERPYNEKKQGQGIFAVWHSPYARILVWVGLLSACQAAAASAAVGWFPYYAERDLGYSTDKVGLLVIWATLVGAFGYYACGRIMERWGRRLSAVAFSLAAVTFGVISFQVHNLWVLVVFLPAAVFFGLGMGPVLSAYATEPFPTVMRAQCSAWIRNAFAIGGSFGGPALVGLIAGSTSHLRPQVGDAISEVVGLLVVGAVIAWRALPETKGISLEAVDRNWESHAGRAKQNS